MNCEHEYEFAERLAEVEQRSKSNTHRIESVEKSQEALNQIATSVAVMAEQQKNISTSGSCIPGMPACTRPTNKSAPALKRAETCAI